MENILIALYYAVAIIIIVVHYFGWLKEFGFDWMVYAVAVFMFPMLYFAYLP